MREPKAWAIGRRVEATFPKKLTADAIRRILSAKENAVTDEEREDAECAFGMFRTKVICRIGDFAKHVCTPTHFAALRRRMGDPSASPADYDCGCNVRDTDGVPICKELRPACKFEGRRRSHHACPNEMTDLNSAWFDAHRFYRNGYLDLLPFYDPEKFAVMLEDTERAFQRANNRRKRAFGEGFKRAVTTFYA